MYRHYVSIRGATTLDCDTEEEVRIKSTDLLKNIISANKVDGKDFIIEEVIASSTSDITSYYPVTAIRLSGLAPYAVFFSCLEPPIKNSLKFCIRLLVRASYCGTIKDIKHIYLGNALSLLHGR